MPKYAKIELCLRERKCVNCRRTIQRRSRVLTIRHTVGGSEAGALNQGTICKDCVAKINAAMNPKEG